MISIDDPNVLLGGLSPRAFLSQYWQKKPLCLPTAYPDFEDFVTLTLLQRLAAREEVVSRLVQQHSDGNWTISHGPFTRRQWQRLPAAGWSLLISNLNHLMPEADQLLQRFTFIPYARLDDVMVSFAPDGGGVGPHVDAYDVFLLQGQGEKEWSLRQTGYQRRQTNTGLQLVEDFMPQQRWRLKTGDILYIPAGCAHHGVQYSPGTTYSIGFRAPDQQEITSQFLMYLAEKTPAGTPLAHPALQPQLHPAELSPSLLLPYTAALREIRWGENDIADFITRYLSLPKQHVEFAAPRRCLSAKQFAKRVLAHGVELDSRSGCLYHAEGLFLNGEPAPFPIATDPVLRSLADQRKLNTQLLNQPQLDWLYEAYLLGYLHAR